MGATVEAYNAVEVRCLRATGDVYYERAGGSFTDLSSTDTEHTHVPQMKLESCRGPQTKEGRHTVGGVA